MSLGTKLNAVQRRGIAAALHHAQQARDWAARHPRRVALAVLSLLGSFAVTAVAIAPLAPDAAKLPQQLVTEAVTPEPLAAQLEALSAQPLQLWRSEITRGTDTADSLLKRLGVADPLAARFIRSDRTARRLLEGRGGKMVRARTETDGTLVELVARFPALDSAQQHTHFTRLTLSKVAGQWLAQIENAPLQVRVQLGSGTIRSTLFGAIDEANLPDSVATQLVEMFANDIDFHRELRRGDTFSVVYEGLVADDQPVSWGEGAGRVLAAEFINKGKAHQAVLFEQNGKPTYFGFDGQNKRRSFLASPLEFSRLTSGFAMRFHPIHQVWKQHLGVDYAAPTGTAVRTVGDGVVEFAGQQRGYGNVVAIKHSQDRSTLYAHLSSIAVAKGQRVEQGQRIGAVGATGYATGPHLHFEFRVNGEHHDPLEIARASETATVEAGQRPRFQQTALVMKTQLKVAETLRGYEGGGE